jgi:hypothetical protein
LFYSNDKMTKEDYEVLLQEIMAYRELDYEEFNFSGEPIRNTGEFKLGSEDAYYEMDIQNIEDLLLYWDDFSINKPNKKSKKKQNKYDRKMYYKKVKHIRNIKNINPWCIYVYDFDTDTYRYWEKCYAQSKDLRRIGNNTIRSMIPGKEKFPLNGGGYKKVYDYWNEIF